MLIGIQVVLHKQSKAKLSDRSFLLFKISELELFYPKTKRVPMFKSSFFKLLFFFFDGTPKRRGAILSPGSKMALCIYAYDFW